MVIIMVDNMVTNCTYICIYIHIIWSVVTGTMEFYDFPFSWESIIIPTDELIFFRRVGIPPTRDVSLVNL